MNRLFALYAGTILGFASAATPTVALAQQAPSATPGVASTTTLRWFNRGDIGSTPWSFDDVNSVGWAQAARAAAQLCGIGGVGAGHFNGHQDTGQGTYGVQCSDADVVWRDASAQEISSSGWSFGDVNQVSWAQANRAAERLCAGANQGFAGGHFNGHQVNGNYGLFCYRGTAKWFDATDAELAATGWGFATPKLDDVQWSQAMRAATGFCQGKGFEGGFMNGHQAPDKYGVVCQRAVVTAIAPLETQSSTTADTADHPAPAPVGPAASEEVSFDTRESRYKMTMRFTNDTCPFVDYRDTHKAEVMPFQHSGFYLPLHKFGTYFDGGVALQGPANVATAGGGLLYSGPVQVKFPVMPNQVPARITGTLSSDLSQFDARFEIEGTCNIGGVIEGQRI